MTKQYSGKWALITGASAGIGEEFATQLAQQGANLVLVARRHDRLETAAKKLEADHAIKTHFITADLADPKSPDMIIDNLRTADIGVDILINNAGFGLDGEYIDKSWQEQRDFIELMVTSYCALTHHLLGPMVERGYGRIIQVASVAGLTPGARGHTLYGATKAFLINFSQSLSAEYKDRGVQTTALCPGFTYTEFHDVNGTRAQLSKLPSYMLMKTEPVVAGGLKALERNHVVYVPGRVNKFIVWIANAIPRPWAANLMIKNSAKFRKNKASH